MKMEGLIPMAYKSLKKNQERRSYECISSEAAQTYKIEDFYTKEEVDEEYHHFKPKTDNKTGSHGSSREFVGRFGSFSGEDEVFKPKQLVRFKSHKIFSCLNGA
ncbi:cysteine-rich venom protein LIO1 [Striga asiatica]|uniref:Cysteine-rich venom protein LIO1 n=1 Tax=Striga asiatica TaxID=4170 RepID=A0A5A7Q0I6_STRAF|nr:cysteine-rich venom protein LIO1 [Striga asiatica]